MQIHICIYICISRAQTKKRKNNNNNIKVECRSIACKSIRCIYETVEEAQVLHIYIVCWLVGIIQYMVGMPLFVTFFFFFWWVVKSNSRLKFSVFVLKARNSWRDGCQSSCQSKHLCLTFVFCVHWQISLQ